MLGGNLNTEKRNQGDVGDCGEGKKVKNLSDTEEKLWHGRR